MTQTEKDSKLDILKQEGMELQLRYGYLALQIEACTEEMKIVREALKIAESKFRALGDQKVEAEALPA